MQGLSIYNPEVLTVTPDSTVGNPSTDRTFNETFFPAVTVGIGGDRLTGTDVPANEITPLGTANNHPLDIPAGTDPNIPAAHSSGIDEGILDARIVNYSTWGVTTTYGNATDSLTTTMLNGSPFTYFTKTGNTAYAKLWLQGTPPQNGQFGDPSLINVWLNDNGLMGVTVTNYIFDSGSGLQRVNQTSYMVLAVPTQASKTPVQWVADNSGVDPNTKQLFKFDMGAGNIVVAVLPQQVDGVSFEQIVQNNLPEAQMIARLFASVATNVPTNTIVSNNTTQGYGYNQSTSLINTFYQVVTPTLSNNTLAPTFVALSPVQYNNLSPSTPASNFQFTLANKTVVTLTYTTENGTDELFHSVNNDFVIQLHDYGLLPELPSVAIQQDSGVTETIFADLQTWVERNLPDPGLLNQPLANTYFTTLEQLSSEMQIADQLAAPTSALSAGDQNLAAQYRNWMLGELEQILYSWFDPSTGRFFYYNETYDSLIGYPAGYKSDYTLNDHHFHYGYFLNAFATVAQYDPTFVENMEPEITQLVDDIANTDPSDTQYPFLREFSPWEMHSWADGLGTGGNNEESASEAINAWAGMEKLGMVLNIPSWVNWGAYMYESEIASMNQYWFNVNADASAGSTGNLPAEFAQYSLNGQQVNVTQTSKVGQNSSGRVLFFGTSNPGAGIYDINWLPVGPQSLYLGRDQSYLAANWAQYVQDATLNGGANNYEGVTAAYQALMPDSGVGVNDPGPSNALLRLDPTVNPAVASSGTPFSDAYGGISRTIDLDWIYTLQTLGQVDTSVVADTASYAVFINNGQRSFVAFNPTATPLSVTFRDINSGQVLATMLVQPNQTLTLLPSGQLISDQPDQGKATGTGTSLYLVKTQNLNSTSSINGSLSTVAGTQTPTFPTQPKTISDYLPGYADTYVNVPARTDPPANTIPTNANAIAQFTMNNVNGTYIPGGSTGIDLFIDNALTDANKAVGVGPGVVQNESLANSVAVIEVNYTFQGSGSPNRTEVYTVTLNGTNSFVEVNSVTPRPGPSYPNVVDQGPQLVPSMSNLTPFQPMVNGTVTVSVWAGQYGINSPNNKEFALSVNASPLMARSSRITIPYTLPTTPVSVLNVSLPSGTSTPSKQKVDSVIVQLSEQGTFTYTALSLKLINAQYPNGVAIPLSNTVVVSLNSDGNYTVTGLSSFQTTNGDYVLTVNGSKILNKAPTPVAGTGIATVSWVVDIVAPTVELLTDTTNGTSNTPIPVTILFSKPVTGLTAAEVAANVSGGSVANFHGNANLYTFTVVPSIVGENSITVNLPANLATDEAGNGNAAATPLKITLETMVPAPIITTAEKGSTNASSIPVTVTFSAAATGFSASNLVVTNAGVVVPNAQAISNFTPVSNSVYTFNLLAPASAKTSPQSLTVEVVSGNSLTIGAATPLTQQFDQSPLTGQFVSSAPQVTFNNPIPVSIIFNKPISGLTAQAIQTTNGQVVAGSLQGSGTNYQLLLQANSGGPVTAQLAAGAVSDQSGNTLFATVLFNRVYQPQASAKLYVNGTSLFTDPALADPTQTNKYITVYAQFSTPVAGLQGKLATNSNPFGLQNATIVGTQALSGTLYAIEVKPTNVDPTNQGVRMTIQLQGSQFLDAYGAPVPASNSLVLTYSVPPGIQSISTPTDLKIGYSNFSITFDKNVLGMDASKLQVVTNNAVISSYISAASPTVTLTALVPAGQTQEIKVVIPAGAIQSQVPVPAGNIPGAPNPQDLVVFDQMYTAPAAGQPGSVTVAVSSSSPTYLGTVSKPFSVTAQFSEKVTLTATDITNNGWPANLMIDPASVKTIDDGHTWTFSVTRTDNAPQVNISLPTIPQLNSLPSNSFTRFFNATPNVINVTGTSLDNPARPGDHVEIKVTFDQPIYVKTGSGIGTPTLALSAGGGLLNPLATYVSGSGTTTLVFDYQVEPGESVPVLNYLSSTALDNKGALFTNASFSGVPLSVSLPLPTQTNSLAQSKIAVNSSPTNTAAINITVDPNSIKPSGDYVTGDQINLQVAFNNPVNVTGTPALDLITDNLAANARAVYTGGSRTNVLTFQYTVGSTDTASPLRVAALDTTNGTLTDAATKEPVSLTVPSPGTPGSLESNTILVIRATGPKLLDLSALVPNPNYDPSQNAPFARFNLVPQQPTAVFGVGATIVIAVNFSDAVTFNSSSPPTLTLNLHNQSGNSVTATYLDGNGTSVLYFQYQVATGDVIPQNALLDITALPTGLTDLSNNPVQLTLPTPGSAASLSGQNPINVLTDAPKIVSVTTATNGTFNTGNGVIIAVTFNRPVKLTSDAKKALLMLNTGQSATINPMLASGLNTTLYFNYGIQSGDNTFQLNYASTTALAGTYVDAAGNVASDTLPDPTVSGSGSMADNSLVVIRSTTQQAGVAGVSTSLLDGPYGVGKTIPIQVTFSTPVTVDTTKGTPSLMLKLDNRTASAPLMVPMGTTVVTGYVLTFLYTVQPGDSAAVLDIASNTPIVNGQNILTFIPPMNSTTPAPGLAANLTFPNPGAGGSLGWNKAIQIVDTSATPAPTILSVTAAGPNAVNLPGAKVAIEVTFSSPVVVTGTPALILAVQGSMTLVVAPYSSGSGTATLTFVYQVAAGQTTALLDLSASLNEVELNGATITDAIDGSNNGLGRSANLTLPTPGSAGSLGLNSVQVIQSNRPLLGTMPSQPLAGASLVFAKPPATFEISPLQVVLQVVDLYGQPLEQAGLTVYLSVLSGPSQFTPLVGVTNAHGQVVFNDVPIQKHGDYQLVATGNDLTQAVSNRFAFETKFLFY